MYRASHPRCLPSKMNGEAMRYQVRVAGRIFEGSDVKALLKCAVQARKEMLQESGGLKATASSQFRMMPRLVSSRSQVSAAEAVVLSCRIRPHQSPENQGRRLAEDFLPAPPSGLK